MMATTLEVISTYYKSPLGRLRIGGTESYINEISYVDNLDRAIDAHSALQGPVPPMIIQCIEQLIQYFQGQRRAFDLPISQDGTAFQQKVWNELTSIPFGKTLSYLDMARRLGDPKSIRAAASANGRINIAIVVPCHRVIGSKRDLVGYAGGLWRKRWLLDHETKILYGVQTLF